MNSLYRERFLRAIGIMDEKGLEKLKKSRIAVGGLGLGGSIFLNLVRMGFENFHIADPDIYERPNFNRQRLAKESTINLRKDDCLVKEALDINPDLKIEIFREGVKPENLSRFLQDIDWVVEVVDLFAMNDKLALNDEANKRGLPVASCASLGFTGTLVVFDGRGPTFRQLSGINENQAYEENLINFLQFIIPEIPPYMESQLFKALDRSSYIPFIVPGVEISAAMAATEIAKHILGMGRRITAPKGICFDPVDLRAVEFEASFRARSLRLPGKKAA